MSRRVKPKQLRYLRKLAPLVRAAIWVVLRIVSFKTVVAYLMAVLALKGLEAAWRRLRQGLGRSDDAQGQGRSQRK